MVVFILSEDDTSGLSDSELCSDWASVCAGIPDSTAITFTVYGRGPRHIVFVPDIQILEYHGVAVSTVVLLNTGNDLPDDADSEFGRKETLRRLTDRVSDCVDLSARSCCQALSDCGVYVKPDATKTEVDNTLMLWVRVDLRYDRGSGQYLDPPIFSRYLCRYLCAYINGILPKTTEH